MQTTGAALLAAKHRSPMRVLMPAQDGRSVYGLLYLSAVRTPSASKNAVKGALTLASFNHGSARCSYSRRNNSLHS